MTSPRLHGLKFTLPVFSRTYCFIKLNILRYRKPPQIDRPTVSTAQYPQIDIGRLTGLRVVNTYPIQWQYWCKSTTCLELISTFFDKSIKTQFNTGTLKSTEIENKFSRKTLIHVYKL